MCGRLASVSAFSSTIVLPSNFPLASSSRIHFVKSLTDELTPPAGAWVSGSRWNFCTHLPSTRTCPSALVARATKSECRELVAGHAERFVELFFRRALPFHAVGFDCGDRRCCYPEVRVGVVRVETAFGMLIA